jgi:hypothetical protein
MPVRIDEPGATFGLITFGLITVGLVGLLFVILRAPQAWLMVVIASTIVFASLGLVVFVFWGFQTWRVRPGTATLTYGWNWLTSIGLKKVLVDVSSVQYELETWDTMNGAWHNVKLTSPGRKPTLVVSRTSRNRVPVSTSADLQVLPEALAVAQVFADALHVPIRTMNYVVRTSDPWWARG